MHVHISIYSFPPTHQRNTQVNPEDGSEAQQPAKREVINRIRRTLSETLECKFFFAFDLFDAMQRRWVIYRQPVRLWLDSSSISLTLHDLINPLSVWRDSI